jgi:hypothetical protein
MVKRIWTEKEDDTKENRGEGVIHYFSIKVESIPHNLKQIFYFTNYVGLFIYANSVFTVFSWNASTANYVEKVPDS